MVLRTLLCTQSITDIPAQKRYLIDICLFLPYVRKSLKKIHRWSIFVHRKKLNKTWWEQNETCDCAPQFIALKFDEKTDSFLVNWKFNENWFIQTVRMCTRVCACRHTCICMLKGSGGFHSLFRFLPRLFYVRLLSNERNAYRIMHDMGKSVYDPVCSLCTHLRTDVICLYSKANDWLQLLNGCHRDDVYVRQKRLFNY